MPFFFTFLSTQQMTIMHNYLIFKIDNDRRLKTIIFFYNKEICLSEKLKKKIIKVSDWFVSLEAILVTLASERGKSKSLRKVL